MSTFIPMTWIEKRFEQKKAAQDHERLIAFAAERVYAELWSEIESCLGEAASKGINVGFNGSPHQRKVLYPNPNPTSFRPERDSSVPTRTLTISLDKPKQMIVVSGLQPTPQLLFDVCPNNVVCLKLNGKEANYSQIAEALLDPFLFPELQTT